MSVDIVMPKMGESIMEGTILKWHKKPGDKVEVDETILEISTDKVDTEVPSPEAGTVSELLYKEGDVVEVGKVIAKLSSNGESATPVEKAAEPVPASKPLRSMKQPPNIYLPAAHGYHKPKRLKTQLYGVYFSS